jgi:uncharacterized protein
MADRKVRILSLDGGGIRGIITGQVLVALEEKLQAKTKDPNARIGQYFDIIAGTSTGGILTCTLLTPSDNDADYPKYTAQDAVNLYLKNGQAIFQKTSSALIPIFGAFRGSKYGGRNMETILKERFGDLRLSQMIKPCLITSYDIQQRRAVFFTSHDAKEKDNYDFLIREVARSTSAAPTYFPPAMARSLDELQLHTIDGGLFANNPTMCAVIECIKLFKTEGSSLRTPDQMCIVSLGTGTVKKKYPYAKATRWGLLGWVGPIIDIMMSGVSETVDYQLRKLYSAIGVSEQYFRIMPDLNDASPEMDLVSSENLENLRQAGIKCADDYDGVLDKIVAMLIENHPTKA